MLQESDYIFHDDNAATRCLRKRRYAIVFLFSVALFWMCIVSIAIISYALSDTLSFNSLPPLIQAVNDFNISGVELLAPNVTTALRGQAFILSLQLGEVGIADLLLESGYVNYQDRVSGYSDFLTKYGLNHLLSNEVWINLAILIHSEARGNALALPSEAGENSLHRFNDGWLNFDSLFVNATTTVRSDTQLAITYLKQLQ